MHMLDYNFFLDVDSYKVSHWQQYPPQTERIVSYIESRGGKWDQHVFFGLQMYLKKYLSKPITKEMVREAELVWKEHGLVFNTEGAMDIVNRYHGMLPIHIEAVPEGTVLPTKNVLVQAWNTDPKHYWLTSFIETALLRAVWYPTTVATNSWHIKQVIKKYLDMTADNPDAEINFKLHDFGARGVSSHESAGIGGAAHLVNFMGTDTMTGAVYARKFYNEHMAGFSIPAAEHSTITSWGGSDREQDAFQNMLDQFAQAGKLVAVVSDSYDIYNACSKLWGENLKKQVVESGATVVVRPDSGDPSTVPVECIELLMDKFGYEVNSKGFKVLPSCVRVIQGDGININTISQILGNMYVKKLSASNIAFGMGGALLQELNRDTLKFAMKCNEMTANSVTKDVYKDPVTDSGKTSKRGKLALVNNGNFKTIRSTDLQKGQENLLKPVYINGHLQVDDDFSVIRKRSNKS